MAMDTTWSELLLRSWVIQLFRAMTMTGCQSLPDWCQTQMPTSSCKMLKHSWIDVKLVSNLQAWVPCHESCCHILLDSCHTSVSFRKACQSCTRMNFWCQFALDICRIVGLFKHNKRMSCGCPNQVTCVCQVLVKPKKPVSDSQRMHVNWWQLVSDRDRFVCSLSPNCQLKARRMADVKLMLNSCPLHMPVH